MTRPAAIRRFELLWWASFAAWLVATALLWSRTRALLLASPATAGVADAVQPATVVLVLLVTALVWWFAARRASGAARWAAVVIAVLAGLRLMFMLVGEASAGLPTPVSTALQVLATALDLAGVAALFRRDAAAWFTPFDDKALEIVE